jgi:Cu+-exporting ATPase
VLVAVDGEVAGVVAVADTIREEAREAVDGLRKLGLEVAMITGDNETSARSVAHELGIERVLAEVMPDGKSEEVEKLQKEGEVVAMEASDLTLISGDVRGVGRAIRLSRATMRNIRQNLFWAFAYNVALIPVAAGVLYPFFGEAGLLSPVFAAAAMALSSVTVVSNALRLRRARLDPEV